MCSFAGLWLIQVACQDNLKYHALVQHEKELSPRLGVRHVEPVDQSLPAHAPNVSALFQFRQPAFCLVQPHANVNPRLNGPERHSDLDLEYPERTAPVDSPDQPKSQARIVEYDHVSIVIAPCVVNLGSLRTRLTQRPHDRFPISLKADSGRNEGNCGGVM